MRQRTEFEPFGANSTNRWKDLGRRVAKWGETLKRKTPKHVELYRNLPPQGCLEVHFLHVPQREPVPFLGNHDNGELTGQKRICWILYFELVWRFSLMQGAI